MSCGGSESSSPLIVMRHCAFCLKEISAGEVLKCGKCHKRAYCSRECQRADWTTKEGKMKGQGHKNWCGIDCGEEDVDWKVTPIPGKGLGILALRDIPTAYRIIVEGGVDPQTHPRVADLMPQGGNWKDKFHLNRLGCEDDANFVLCLRISRANHACDANANHQYDKASKAKILYSVRNIKAGEEICISYVGFNDIGLPTETPEVSRQRLRSKWGIVCPESTCLCYNKAYNDKIKHGRELDTLISDYGQSGNITGALAKVKELLELEKELGLELICMRRTLFDGFQVAITKRATMKRGLELISQAYELLKKIQHPEKSELVNEYKLYMEDPSAHEAYLLMEV